MCPASAQWFCYGKSEDIVPGSAVSGSPKRFSGIAPFALDGVDAVADINQIGVLLLGVVLGWLVMFAVRRYRVQWGAFATFVAVLFGVGILMFLYKFDLLGYYGIGIFVGFFANVIVRAVGVAKGGKAGEALTEISMYPKREERK